MQLRGPRSREGGFGNLYQRVNAKIPPFADRLLVSVELYRHVPWIWAISPEQAPMQLLLVTLVWRFSSQSARGTPNAMNSGSRITLITSLREMIPTSASSLVTGTRTIR